MATVEILGAECRAGGAVNDDLIREILAAAQRPEV
ncbi:hypothetical protein, partial [Pseudomonas aeruginosa]|nr:hypothetical protein [Pseudomonas aeruginosa]